VHIDSTTNYKAWYYGDFYDSNRDGMSVTIGIVTHGCMHIDCEVGMNKPTVTVEIFNDK